MKQILSLSLGLILGVLTVYFVLNGIIHAAIISGLITIAIGLIHIFSLIGEAKEEERKVYKNAFKDKYLSDKW